MDASYTKLCKIWLSRCLCLDVFWLNKIHFAGENQLLINKSIVLALRSTLRIKLCLLHDSWLESYCTSCNYDSLTNLFFSFSSNGLLVKLIVPNMLGHLWLCKCNPIKTAGSLHHSAVWVQFSKHPSLFVLNKLLKSQHCWVYWDLF